MPKRKGKNPASAGRQHASKKFADMVGKSNQEALKGYVQQLFQNFVQNAQQQLMSAFAVPNTRITVLERIAKEKHGYSDDDLRELYADEEDKAWGLEKVDGEAQEKDMLRVQIKGKGPKDEDFGEAQPFRVRSLLTEPYSINKEVEEKLVGAKPGSVVEVPVSNSSKVQNEDGKTEEIEETYTFSVEIERISRPVKQEEKETKAQEETENAES